MIDTKFIQYLYVMIGSFNCYKLTSRARYLFKPTFETTRREIAKSPSAV